jgi:hypothetical protein
LAVALGRRTCRKRLRHWRLSRRPPGWGRVAVGLGQGGVGVGVGHVELDAGELGATDEGEGAKVARRCALGLARARSSGRACTNGRGR